MHVGGQEGLAYVNPTNEVRMNEDLDESLCDGGQNKRL